MYKEFAIGNVGKNAPIYKNRIFKIRFKFVTNLVKHFCIGI